MVTDAAITKAGSRRPGRQRLLGAAVGAALVLAGVTGLADHPAGPRRTAPAAARPGSPVVGSVERAPSPPAPQAAVEAFEILRAGPTPTCAVRRVPAAGGASPDAVVVYREDLAEALVDLCGAGWALAPADARDRRAAGGR
jgi:hypothetical protein